MHTPQLDHLKSKKIKNLLLLFAVLALVMEPTNAVSRSFLAAGT